MMNIQEFFAVYKTGEERKLEEKEMGEWTKRLVEELNIWTEEAIRYRDVFDEFLSRINASKKFLETFRAIEKRLLIALRTGKQEEIMSVRWL